MSRAASATLGKEVKVRVTALLVLVMAACRAGDSRSDSTSVAPEVQTTLTERVVQQQFDAYNRRDLEGFVAAHAPNVRVYRYPDSLVIDGREALRERFGKLFANAPQLHATVDDRMTHGDLVIWKETVTGMPGGRTSTAMSMWEIHDGLITRILFIP
jgi:hypothetical protein